MATTKRVFISDLHMGTERSVSQKPPLHDYCWLNKNAKHLGRFLGQLLNRTDVSELVIVGDMLDDWVIPASFDPSDGQNLQSTFDEILAAPQNKTIVSNLKLLAGSNSNIKVSYVPGNHDMTVEKAFLEQNFPGINCLGTYNPGLGVYQTGIIRAEHGHRFCLFNAPDDLTGNPSYLPLGYYISRCDAQDCLGDGDGVEYMSLLASLIKDLFKENGKIPAAVLDAMAKDAGMKGNSRFKMSEQDSPSVAEIRKRFADIMSQWNKSHDHPEVDATQALLADAGMLENAVWHVYGKAAKKSRIAICGHTHAYALWAGDKYGYTNLAMSQDDPTPTDGYAFVYANSGTWVDQVNIRTYVETEEVPNEGRHYVRVMKYASDGVSVEMLGTHTGI